MAVAFLCLQLNSYTIMSKQKEQAAPAEQEQRFENEKFDAALHELQCLEAGLNLDGASEQTKFFLYEIRKRLKEATNRTYQDSINQLCSYFNDSGTTYTRQLELMVESMLEVQRLQNIAIEHGGDDLTHDETLTKSTQEFFFQMSLLLWDCKPIAIDQERRLQRKGSEYVGYNVVKE